LWTYTFKKIMFFSVSLAVVLITQVVLSSAGRLTSSEPKQESKHWALLVAGSYTYGNYRHQADVCHAYQILHKHGIPDEQIVVMMYDDIAYNEQNPTQGIIINKPNGSDVYHGVPKDYTKKDVTPENFLKILKGDKEGMRGIGSGKVIESGPNDYVFVNFVDHGAPGLVAFPSGELMANKLINAINYMHENKKYQQVVFYIEACESGSMFQNKLPTNTKVYGTTAANAHESSYACYWDAKREAYLGDVYSVKWMEDSDRENLNLETLLKQYKIVKKRTTTSHVMKYGDMSFDNEVLDEFQGDGPSGPVNVKPSLTEPDQPVTDAVPAPDVPLVTLERRLASASSEEKREKIRKQIEKLLEMRNKVIATAERIAKVSISDDEPGIKHVLTSKANPQDFECYEEAVRRYSEKCFNIGENEYALRHVYVLSNLCEKKIPTTKILKAIEQACQE